VARVDSSRREAIDGQQTDIQGQALRHEELSRSTTLGAGARTLQTFALPSRKDYGPIM